jgi:hypothetical protein
MPQSSAGGRPARQYLAEPCFAHRAKDERHNDNDEQRDEVLDEKGRVEAGASILLYYLGGAK